MSVPGAGPDPLGEGLRDLADQLVGPAQVPAHLRPRAARRRRLKITALGSAAAAVIGVAFVGGTLVDHTSSGVNRLIVPPAATPSSAAHPHPVVTVTVTATATATAPPSYRAGAACQAGQLSVQAGSFVRAGRHVGVRVVLTNASPVACLLTGFAGLAGRLPNEISPPGLVAVYGGVGALEGHPPTPSTFLLNPGGSASFLAGWTRSGVGPCYQVKWLEVTPPNTTTQVFVSIPISQVCGEFGESALAPGS